MGLGFKYVGENSPELQAWPESERRAVFLKALRLSYRRVITWAGFAAFLWMTGFPDSLTGFIVALAGLETRNIPISAGQLGASIPIRPIVFFCGWFVLGMTQIWAIRSELRKMMTERDHSHGNH